MVTKSLEKTNYTHNTEESNNLSVISKTICSTVVYDIKNIKDNISNIWLIDKPGTFITSKTNLTFDVENKNIIVNTTKNNNYYIIDNISLFDELYKETLTYIQPNKIEGHRYIYKLYTKLKNKLFN